jgi:hypothetical protein
MNCNEPREKLIDLAYGELSDAEASALQQHIEGCDDCRAELAALRSARIALAEFRASEPATGRLRMGGPSAAAAGRVIRFARWLPALTALAAAVMIVATIWMFESTPTAIAGPVEIKQMGVSLTILSQPEGWRAMPMEMQQRKMQQEIAPNAPMQTWQSYQVSPYWRGMALVRDHRLIRNLKAGQTSVRFTNVPTAIMPDTVRLRSLDDPEGLSILEQNYQYDLATTWAVLKRYVDKPITIEFRKGEPATGTLLSFDGASLVIRPEGEGPRTVAREHVRAIRFEKLPEGLLSKPMLVWDLQNNAAREQQFEVAYLTRGIAWRADYVLKLHPGGKGEIEGEDAIVDTADLVGYATVINNSGVTYEGAQLKLLAGEVNLIKPPQMDPFTYLSAANARLDSEGAAPQFQEKSFFEYHLYTLGRKTTIRSAETKQIELVSGGGLKLKRAYVYDRNQNRTAARVVSEFKNTEENGLGKPLPKGVVRLYAPDPDGEQTYIAKTTIDHTPKNEKLRLPWSYAFDIVCEHKLTKRQRRGNDYAEAWQYSLRNHKDYDVTITVIARVPRSTYQANCKRSGKAHPWHIREVGIIEIEVPVKANGAEKVTLDFRYNNTSGGGLVSPHDSEG